MQYKAVRPFSLLILFCISSTSALADEPKIYTLGVVPQFETRKLHKIWKPIAKAIENKIGIKLRITGSPTIPEFEHEFMRGEFDFAYMNPYHLFIANKTQGYIPLVKDTGKKLFGIIVIPNNSPVKSIMDLNDKTIAFPAPNALGA